MIPFNHLGIFFNRFASLVYPQSVRNSLCKSLDSISSSSKVLDIGSGTGILCQFGYECRKDLEYVAVDPAQGMMKYAKKYVRTHKAVAEALPFHDESFDVVMMGESLHHFQDVDQALQETVRVLTKRGKLFIYDFNRDTFMGKSIYRGEILLGEPGHFFTPIEIEQKLKTYGFSVVITNHGWRYTLDAIKTTTY